MKNINLLDSATINAIAAGEVVERPASVVKELVENAIDAHATAVTVEIAGGGIDMIRATDNGSGIDRDDIEDAFKRHATSKIKNAMDLVTVGSLGFRGEALSSIAAVSQIELISKTRLDIVGVRYLAEGGVKHLLEDVGCPEGTTIIVRNLFFNTPARKKFLKSPAAEGSGCADLVGRLALSRPDISFKLISNGQTRLHTSGNSKLRDIIYQIYGRDVSLHLLEAERQTPLMRISGYIGKPILSRGNRSWENYFINGRYIKSAVITKAIEDAYKTFVMIHRFPFTALHIQMEPELTDVNVHPRKMEIKFDENEAVYSQVFETVRGILQGRELTPAASMSREGSPKKAENVPSPEPFELKRLAMMGKGRSEPPAFSGKKPASRQGAQTCSYQESPEKKDLKREGSQIREEKHPWRENFSQERLTVPAPQEKKEEPAAPPGKRKLLDKSSRGLYRLIGQVFGTYWMIEFDGKLYVMDQHAAHEKVLFEKIRRDFQKNTLAVQQLAPPAVITLTPIEQALAEKYKDYFQELCFEIEPFGGDQYAIYGVPVYLFGMNAKDLFIEILDNLTQESGNIEGSAMTWRIASMACKAAVKGNSRISPQEALALIDQLTECEDPYNCPHGRPTIISFSRYELDKRFKRIQD